MNVSSNYCQTVGEIHIQSLYIVSHSVLIYTESGAMKILVVKVWQLSLKEGGVTPPGPHSWSEAKLDIM